MSNCTNEFPTTDQLFEDLKDDSVIIALTAVAGVFTLVTIIIFVEEVVFLITKYTYKAQRNKVFVLLALYPVVSSSCMIGLMVPRSMMLTELLSSIYLSFCLLIFVHKTIEYFSGETVLLREMATHPFSFSTPPCCCCFLCLRNMEFSRRNLRIAKMFALQVVVVRPIVLFIRAVMWSDGDYQLGEALDPGRFSFYLQILNAVSTLFGMYGLIAIYRNTAHRLTDYRLRIKFVSLQLAFVLLNLQSFVIMALARYDIPACKGVRGSVVRGYRTHYFLLILEFFLLSILARFGYRRYEEPRKLDTNSSIEVNNEKNFNSSSDRQKESGFDNPIMEISDSRVV